MTSPPRTSTHKRKHSDSPTRKKARTVVADAPATTTPTPVLVQTTATDDEEFAAFYRQVVGEDPPPPPLAATPTTDQTQPVMPTAVTGPPPTNPFAGKVKPLRGNFGTGTHDVAHFQPTQNKVHHGVW